MAPKYRYLISLLILIGAIAVASILWGSGLFHLNEAVLIFASCICAYACVSLHIGKQRPESLVIIAAATFFLIAYVAQAILFIVNTRSNLTTLTEAISIRSIFSLAALGAGPTDVQQSLAVVLTGFVGILLPAIYLALNSKGETWVGRHGSNLPTQTRLVVSNPMTIGYIAIIWTIFFGILRKYLGLDSPAPTDLPMGIGGMINIASIYIGPNLLLAALFFALDHGPEDKVRRLIFFSITLGLFNYILFTSKLSLIFPVLYVLLCQYLLGRSVISIRTIGILFGIFLVVYPFLNLYRSAIALGVDPGNLIATIADLYANSNEASDIDRNVLQVAIGAIIGRFVGYDPLLILLQANPYPGTLLDYFLHGDLDKYLTYTILDFDEGMGYSPGFLGRLFYISVSYTFLLMMTALTVLVLAWLVRTFWRGNPRQRFMVPFLLTYCLMFFTDGIRFELFRALVLSSLFIFGLLRMVTKLRAVSSQLGS